ncbi:MAG: molybdopterin cofactor-binding domain-containing protein, partial [Anaerolineaceae bacterium]|nr:molybdopterin cofactor-binding domain-containing protein [Anaerolineaceae bacterium]
MNDQGTLNFIVNGKAVSLSPVAGEMLSDLLRERLGLTGTKIGCNEAECGACTVLVDNEPVLSCSYPAARAQGKNVVTIEGLVSNGLHPLQDAFVKYGAVQCGYCIPGQIMTAYGLILSNPSPTLKEIRSALKDTLCRCGCYPAIEKAIMAAAHSIRTGEPIQPPSIQESIFPHHAVGKVHARPEAVEKVTGSAKYTDDLQFPEMLYGMAKRALLPHGIVRKIDVTQAKQLAGVHAVLTAEDIPGEINHGLVIYDWPTLVGVGQRVRYVGDAVALVAAETRDIAMQAIDLIKVDYKPLPVISDPVQSHHTQDQSLHEKGNLLKHIKVRKGNIEDGFTHSEIILEHTFHTQFTDHAFIEPECSIARLVESNHGERVEIFVGSQIPYADRVQVSRVLNLPEDKVRIRGMLIGGGFGGKEDITGQIHAALLAVKTRRPVKVLYDRHESLLVHPKRHATQIRVKLGARKDGSLVAVETELYGDTGAYASLGEKVMTRATTHSAGPYVVEHVKADCYAMYT